MTNEEFDTTTARIKLPRKVSEPVYIKFEDLEAFREMELARRRERVEAFKSQGW